MVKFVQNTSISKNSTAREKINDNATPIVRHEAEAESGSDDQTTSADDGLGQPQHGYRKNRDLPQAQAI